MGGFTGMTILFIIVYAINGPDQLFVDWGPGPPGLHLCSIVTEGDGTRERAILEAVGRKRAAARPHTWEPWEAAA
jgi:hypothetical protein